MRTRIIAIATVLSGLVSAQTLKDAVTKTENERYESAAADFRALIAKNANNGQNYFYFGENYFNSEDVDSAEMMYKKGTEVAPTEPLNFVGLGKILLSKNDVNGAKAQFFKATSISQNKNAEVFRKIAEAYLVTEYKNPDEAITVANTAIKLDKNNPDGYIILGDAMLEKNPSDGGGPIRMYKQATTLDPKSAKGIIREGKLYQRGRNYQLALDKYKEAEAIDATFAPAYREKAELYFLANQPSKSIENWKKYLELNNSDYARYRYMSALFKGKQYAEAVTEYEGLKTGSFKNLYLERLAGYSYAEMGDKKDKEAYTKGLAAINNFFKMAGPNFKYLASDYKYKGILLTKTGQDSLAYIELQKAIDKDKSVAGEMYSEMASIAYGNKNYPKVVAVMEMKEENEPGSLSNTDYYSLGKANYYMGQAKLIEANNIKDKKGREAKAAEAIPYMVKADSAFSGLVRKNPTWPPAYTW
ncbi:MAG: tetratricopeptide repeat protein, partial [Bacteroidia bacterium]